MKRLLVSVCLIVCLLGTTACESAITKLSSAIRYGWDRLNGRIDAPDPEPSDFTEVEDVPGEPLNDREKEIIVRTEAIRKIAIKPTNSANEAAKIVAAEASLNQLYPPVKQPVNRLVMQEALKILVPDRLGDYVLEKQDILWQGDDDNEEELIPGLNFPMDPSYPALFREYKKSEDRKMLVVVVDRGNLAEWVRTAHWYYVRKGAVGAEEQAKMRFLKTLERKGRTWVVWESKVTKLKFIMLWHGRWQVYINAVDDLADADPLFNSAWLDRMDQ